MSEGQTFGFPPVGFANGGKPRQFAPWHFVSLALFIQGRLIDRILAHFWWILVKIGYGSTTPILL